MAVLTDIPCQEGDYNAMPFEPQDYKLVRAASRSRTCYRKRIEYTRACNRREEADRAAPCQAVPYGAWRAAARTQLARGSVEAAVDLPRMSHYGLGTCKRQRQSRLRRPQQACRISAICSSSNSCEQRPSEEPPQQDVFAGQVRIPEELSLYSSEGLPEDCEDRSPAAKRCAVEESAFRHGDSAEQELYRRRSNDKFDAIPAGADACSTACSMVDDVQEVATTPRRARAQTEPIHCSTESLDADITGQSASAPSRPRAASDGDIAVAGKRQPKAETRLQELLEARAFALLEPRAAAEKAYEEQEWELVADTEVADSTAPGPQRFNIGDDANTQCFDIADDETPACGARRSAGNDNTYGMARRQTAPRQSSWGFLTYLTSAIR
eukprot:TRINITY_DN24572_c0_g1_i1.p1 TRINITY_DN24572_c0_g1~~TRINITY_DN24572_c0_g1_i1.p1  ORF type:complete len:382 (-),score=76.70 TRINITY_DN24572_c0_g1_i1:609-1754(-)